MISSLIELIDRLVRRTRGVTHRAWQSRRAHRNRSTRNALFLEILEGRDVPSTFLLDSPFVAQNTDWGNLANWTDVTTGLPATRAPGAYDDVMIGAKSESFLNVFNPSDCRSINVSPLWPGHIDLSGTSLTVWGVNGADSQVWSGAIATPTADGNLIINGGTFTYDANFLNVWLVNPGKLDVYVNQSATFDVTEDCQVLNATFYVGTTPTGTLSYGSLDFDTTSALWTSAMMQGNSVNVSSAGSVFFTPFSSMAGLTLSDVGGGVYMANQSYAASSAINAISISNGGFMECLGSGGSATVRGTLSFDDGTLMMPGVAQDGSGGYFTLKADNLAMGRGSTFDFHVSAVTNGLCDTIFALAFSTDGTAKSVCHTDGAPAPGVYDYDPIMTTANGFNGQFGFYVWDGWLGNGYIWTPSYPGAQGYHLSGTVLNPMPAPGPIPGPAPAPLPAPMLAPMMW